MTNQNTNSNTCTMDIEYTDTFNGDANYSWVQRETIVIPENLSSTALIRRVKKQLGITVKHIKHEYSADDIRLDLIGCCRVIFITYKEES